MRRKIQTPPPPYVRYTEEEISYQPGMTQGRTRVAFKLHRLDKGSGTYVRDEVISAKMGMTIFQYRSYRRQLEALGYVVLIGYTRRNVARYRVVLRHRIDPDIRGSMIEIPLSNGLKARRPRKKNEAAPNIVVDPNSQSYWPPDGHHIGTLSENISVVSSKEETSNLFSSPNEVAVVASPSIAPEASPNTESASGDTSPPPHHALPVTGEVGTYGSWMEEFNATAIAGPLLKAFGLPSITPRLARMVVNRLRRGTFDDEELLFVIKHVGSLSSEAQYRGRRPSSIEDFLSRYTAIRDRVQMLVAARCRTRHSTACNEIESPEALWAHPNLIVAFGRARSVHGWTSMSDFIARSQPDHHIFAWVAAYAFKNEGDDVFDYDGGVLAAMSCIMNPPSYKFAAEHLKFNLEKVTGLTEAEAMTIRCGVLAQRNRWYDILLDGLPIRQLIELDKIYSYGLLRYQVETFIDTGSIYTLEASPVVTTCTV